MFKHFLISLLLLHIALAGFRVRRRRRSCSAVNGGWSGWINTSGCNCNHATGVGYISQIRHCNNPSPSCGGAGCGGPATQNVGCPCCKTTPGGWSSWAAWGQCNCDANTGTGTRSTTRSCSNPAPSCGGAACAGTATKTERCDNQCCKKTDGGWTAWTTGKCSCDFNTGTGTHVDTRSCTKPTPSCGGKSCAGSATKTEHCDDQCCKKTDGGWAAWNAWSVCYCDRQSGTGVKLSSRSCTSPAPSCGGAQCSGDSSRSQQCNDECCTKTDGGWSAYGPFTKCTCDPNTGKGTKTAVKTCTNPLPACGGAMCQGSAIKTVACDKECCVKVDGGWSTWGPWVSDCDSHCGTGSQHRNRTCTNPTPKCNGKECEGVTKVKAECSNTCGVVIGEGAMTTGDPVKVKCTLYGNTRQFLGVQWRTKSGGEIVDGGDYHFLPDVVTPYYSTMSMVVSNLKADGKFVCSFVFGKDQVVSADVLVDFVEMSFLDWN